MNTTSLTQLRNHRASMQARSSFVTATGGHRVHRHRGHRVHYCYWRSSCSSSSRSSFITAIGGHRVHRHRGHRSSLLSEVIVFIAIEVSVHQCYQRSSCLSSSRSSLSLQSEVIVCIYGIVIIAIGVKIYRRYGRELRSYIDVVIAKIGSKK